MTRALRALRIASGLAALTLSLAAVAQAPIVYPAKGQSAAQQQKDDGECYAWAKSNTGIDPVAVAQAPAPGPGGRRVAGAAKGAIVGGLVTGGDSHGATAGAVVGTMAGGSKARQQQQGQAQASQQAMSTFYRAYGACMEGRNYTLK